MVQNGGGRADELHSWDISCVKVENFVGVNVLLGQKKVKCQMKSGKSGRVSQKFT